MIKQYKKSAEGKTLTKKRSHAEWEKSRIEKGKCVKCKDDIAPTSGRYCEKHRIQSNERSRKYTEQNKEKCSYRTKISGHRARVRVMKMLGGLVCAWCGEKDYRVLSIDHINGHEKSVSERSRLRTGVMSDDVIKAEKRDSVSNYMYKIERGEIDTANLRVLCMNCQARNEHKRGNRQIYPELREAILEAGGFVGD